MIHVLKLSLLTLTLLCATGCTTGYWTDRGRDAADVSTLTVGYGIGVKAQVGPVQTGLFANRDFVGLRGGTCDIWDVPPFGENGTFELDVLIHRVGSFDPQSKTVTDRRKFLGTVGVGPITWPFRLFPDESNQTPHHYTQVEVAVGFGPSLRIGFNPGELLDLLLGFFGVDIYNDDLERRKKQKIERDTSVRAVKKALKPSY